MPFNKLKINVPKYDVKYINIYLLHDTSVCDVFKYNLIVSSISDPCHDIEKMAEWWRK